MQIAKGNPIRKFFSFRSIAAHYKKNIQMSQRSKLLLLLFSNPVRGGMRERERKALVRKSLIDTTFKLKTNFLVLLCSMFYSRLLKIPLSRLFFAPENVSIHECISEHNIM